MTVNIPFHNVRILNTETCINVLFVYTLNAKSSSEAPSETFRFAPVVHIIEILYYTPYIRQGIGKKRERGFFSLYESTVPEHFPIPALYTFFL